MLEEEKELKKEAHTASVPRSPSPGFAPVHRPILPTYIYYPDSGDSVNP